MTVFLQKTKIITSKTIDLPSSKSESNRALVINALAGGQHIVDNLSEARDTQTMLRLLKSNEHVLDVMDAGTTMRFLTAYYSILNQHKVITGSQRMRQRPIGLLVNALRQIGADIRYSGQDGFPPVELTGFIKQLTDQISIRGDVSSQFISALLMVAPMLKNGLNLTLTGKIGSKPYIGMTLGIMEHFGVNNNWIKNEISIQHQSYIGRPFIVAPDWSAASYWYSLVALTGGGDIRLSGLKKNSFQGDKVIAEIMFHLGVKSQFDSDGVMLTRKDYIKEYGFDFSDCPDLAQTVAVVAAAKGITFHLSGLESLRIKETDRILALQTELAKTGSIMKETAPGVWTVFPTEKDDFNKTIRIDTYDDHRMAMAFAPLASLHDIEIENPDVVKKSYPNFWTDLGSAGIKIKF